MRFRSRRLKKIFAPIARFIGRFHITLFILILLLSLITAVYTTNQTLSQPEDAAYRQQAEAEAPSADFDQDTIERVEQLHHRQDDAALQLPGGRINPFVEG